MKCEVAGNAEAWERKTQHVLCQGKSHFWP